MQKSSYNSFTNILPYRVDTKHFNFDDIYSANNWCHSNIGPHYEYGTITTHHHKNGKWGTIYGKGSQGVIYFVFKRKSDFVQFSLIFG